MSLLSESRISMFFYFSDDDGSHCIQSLGLLFLHIGSVCPGSLRFGTKDCNNYAHIDTANRKHSRYVLVFICVLLGLMGNIDKALVRDSPADYAWIFFSSILHRPNASSKICTLKARWSREI